MFSCQDGLFKRCFADNIYHIRHCQHRHVFFSAWKLSGPHFLLIFFHLERISIHYWAETLIRTLQHSHTLPYTAGSTHTTVFSVLFIYHIVTVARKCIVSRDDSRQFWSRPDQKHDSSGRDANCISRCWGFLKDLFSKIIKWNELLLTKMATV